MTNKEKYQQAFSVLKASEKIEMEDLKMKSFNLSKAVAVAAAVAVCFVGSNGICYAATGATWVEKMVVHFNGEPREMDVEVKDMGDGSYGYSFELPGDGEYTMDVPENSSVGVAIVTEQVPEEFHADIYTDFAPSAEGALLEIETAIEEVDGIQWFCVGEERVDITEDFADGEVGVLLPVGEEQYHFLITGTVEEYSIIMDGPLAGVSAE